MQILENFDKGKCWEKGIPLCKELADFYETRRFDYNRLSDILKMQAQFTQKILKQIRQEPEYFRVCFYGMDFPLFVRVRVTCDGRMSPNYVRTHLLIWFFFCSRLSVCTE